MLAAGRDANSIPAALAEAAKQGKVGRLLDHAAWPVLALNSCATPRPALTSHLAPFAGVSRDHPAVPEV